MIKMVCMFYFAPSVNITFNSLRQYVHKTRKIKSIHAIFYHTIFYHILLLYC